MVYDLDLLKILYWRENTIPIHMYGQLANRMMSLLSGAERKELQLNSMGENHRYNSQGDGGDISCNI